MYYWDSSLFFLAVAWLFPRSLPVLFSLKEEQTPETMLSFIYDYVLCVAIIILDGKTSSLATTAEKTRRNIAIIVKFDGTLSETMAASVSDIGE